MLGTSPKRNDRFDGDRAMWRLNLELLLPQLSRKSRRRKERKRHMKIITENILIIIMLSFKFTIISFDFYCPIETIIHHNFPSEVDAGDCETRRCAKHKVVYDITMPQIIALIEQSAECRQFTKVTSLQVGLRFSRIYSITTSSFFVQCVGENMQQSISRVTLNLFQKNSFPRLRKKKQ